MNRPDRTRLSLPRCLLALWLLYGLPASSSADSNPATHVHIHGFLTQGYTLTSANNFFGDSTDEGSFEFTELGINGFWQFSPRLHAAAQLLSRRAGSGSDGTIRLDYGVLDYRVLSDENQDFGARLGRFKNPLGLYNDTRDVAFTRPSIILPQSIYFDRTRDLALSSDGLQLYANRRSTEGEWEFQLGIGRPDVDDKDTELSVLGGNRPGELKDETSYIARLMYERDGGQIRLGITHAQLNMDYRPGMPDPSGPGSIRFSPTILSAQYNDERWSLTGEYAKRPLKFGNNIVYVPPPLKDITGESYYLQGSYQFDPRWEGLLRYDVTYLNDDDRNGRFIEALSGGARPAYSQYARDWTVGLRWSPNRAWMVRAEHHWVDGTAWLPLQDNPIAADTERRWRLFSLLVSYRF